jgi:hypothetical protein
VATVRSSGLTSLRQSASPMRKASSKTSRGASLRRLDCEEIIIAHEVVAETRDPRHVVIHPEGFDDGAASRSEDVFLDRRRGARCPFSKNAGNMIAVCQAMKSEKSGLQLAVDYTACARRGFRVWWSRRNSHRCRAKRHRGLRGLRRHPRRLCQRQRGCSGGSVWRSSYVSFSPLPTRWAELGRLFVRWIEPRSGVAERRWSSAIRKWTRDAWATVHHCKIEGGKSRQVQVRRMIAGVSSTTTKS